MRNEDTKRFLGVQDNPERNFPPHPRSRGSLENLSPAHVGKKSFHFKMTKQREENFINAGFSPSPSGIKGRKSKTALLSLHQYGDYLLLSLFLKKEFPTVNEMTWQKLTINLIRSEFRSINLHTVFENLRKVSKIIKIVSFQFSCQKCANDEFCNFFNNLKFRAKNRKVKTVNFKLNFSAKIQIGKKLRNSLFVHFWHEN